MPDFQQFYSLRLSDVVLEWDPAEVLLLVQGLGMLGIELEQQGAKQLVADVAQSFRGIHSSSIRCSMGLKRLL